MGRSNQLSIGSNRESICGGFILELDDDLWNEGYTERFENAETWIYAIQQILRGKKSGEWVWAWEESQHREFRLSHYPQLFIIDTP